MTPEVKAALDHVRSVFPDVVKVKYDQEGRWLFMTKTGFAPRFDGKIDICLLEDAADSVQDTPVTFYA